MQPENTVEYWKDKVKQTYTQACKETGELVAKYETESFNDFFTQTEYGRKIIPEKAATALMKENTFITFADNNEILYYDNGIYIPGGEVLIKKIVEDKARKEIKIQLLNEIIGHVQRSTYVNKSDIGTNKNEVHLLNGILNLETMQVMPFSKDKISIIQLPIEYDQEAQPEKFLKFLTEILPEKTDQDCIQELFGYFLSPEYNHHKAFMFIGPGGNGKSTLIDVMRIFLGSKNISAVELQALEDNQFMAALLYGKIANLNGDIGPKSLQKTSTFKILCGNDLITVDNKYGKPFQFVNRAKMVFACNQLPEIQNPTPADFRRWIVLQFNQVFEGNAADTELLQKISTKKEISGILNWAISGLKRLNEQHGFTYNKSMAEMQTYYTRLSEPIGAFCQDAIIEDSESYITKELLISEFYIWCKKYKIAPPYEIKFWQKIKQLYPFGHNTRGGSDGNRVQRYDGITFNSNYKLNYQKTKETPKIDIKPVIITENDIIDFTERD
jgi:putative DNA primase/helicase